mmetsp:Transcript_61660/g.121918  ORF Transcript_61660/g.121918 Transcript_61660/m.121918 type:complete len:215 (-) Transcript_61660:110-754(-)
MMLPSSRMQVLPVGEGDHLIVRAMNHLHRRLVRAEPSNIMEVEHVHQVDFGSREEHPRARREARDEHHAPKARAAGEVAGGARADRFSVKHDVTLRLQLEAIDEQLQRGARVRVHVILRRCACRVAVAGVLVREHVDAQSLRHVRPEAEHYPEILRIRMRDQDREGVAVPDVESGNPVSLVCLDPHVDVLLAVGRRRWAKCHLVYRVRGHIPHG